MTPHEHNVRSRTLLSLLVAVLGIALGVGGLALLSPLSPGSLSRLAASAAIRVTVVPIPPPPAPDTTTMRPSSVRRSLMFVRLVRTTYGALHIVEHYSAVIIAPSRSGWPGMKSIVWTNAA